MSAGGPGSGRHKQMVKAIEDKGFFRMTRTHGGVATETWTDGKNNFMSIKKDGSHWQHFSEKKGGLGQGNSVDSLKTHLSSVPKVHNKVGI
jgi:hypothetical protein